VSNFDVTIHTDGSCIGNPGPGGWAAILTSSMGSRSNYREISGHRPSATNNEMELVAVLEALKALKMTGLSVAIYTDSQNVIGWLSGEYSTKNARIAQLVRDIKTVVECKYLAVDWFYVKGHNGCTNNVRADQLARNRARSYQEV
jgi:ribonuclease HI